MNARSFFRVAQWSHRHLVRISPTYFKRLHLTPLVWRLKYSCLKSWQVTCVYTHYWSAGLHRLRSTILRGGLELTRYISTRYISTHFLSVYCSYYRIIARNIQSWSSQNNRHFLAASLHNAPSPLQVTFPSLFLSCNVCHYWYRCFTVPPPPCPRQHPTDKDRLTAGSLVPLITMNLSGIHTVTDGSPAFPHPYLEPRWTRHPIIARFSASSSRLTAWHSLSTVLQLPWQQSPANTRLGYHLES